MNIIFAGTGSAFCMKNYQSNILIHQNGKYLLFDAGGDVRFALRDVGLSYKDISALYISHLHADHAGGLEFLGFCTYFDPSCKEKIQLVGNGDRLRKGWNDTWKGGLESIQGKVLTLESYFDLNMVRPNGRFYWEGLEFSIVQTVHIMNGYSIVPSYGLMVGDPKYSKTVFLVGDSQFNPNQLMDFYKIPELIIQDCEVTPFKSGVHANYQELCTLPEDIKKKMILQHYQDLILDDEALIKKEWVEKAENDGFWGFARRKMNLQITTEVSFTL